MSSDRADGSRTEDDADPADGSTGTGVETERSEGDEPHERSAVAADLRKLVTEIEAIHPEPYLGYDGRVPLHARLESTVRDLPATATDEEVFRLAASLVAGLEDAHSRAVPPEGDGDDGPRLPVSLRVVGKSIYVDGVYDDSLEDLLGGRVLAVEGEPVGTMADRYADLRGSENRYFALMALSGKIESYDWFDRLLDTGTVPPAPTLRIRTEDGTEVTRSLDPVPADLDPTVELETTTEIPDGTGPRYDLYDDGRTAVFVPGNLMTYREVIQGARERGAGYAESIARDAYEEHFEGSPPKELDDLVAALPSMTETLTEMVREMKAAGTESLVVDLRDNPGGDSRFVQMLGYVLFGWERLVDGSDWEMAIKRRTDRHRERYGVPDGSDDEYATFEDNPAGYDFGPRFRNQDRDFEERLADLKGMVSAGDFGDELEDGTHEGYYEPDRVVVATTAGTMSSAFAGAALLSELGADVVGVPSGQAPLSFGEALEVELPNTGLSAEISGSMYRWTRDPDGQVLPMARELTPELFEERYDRAGDATLRLALDWASREDGRTGDPPE